MGNEKLREAFNEFVKLNGCSVMKRDGEYVESMTRLWWKCWQAATAANQRDAMAVAEEVESAFRRQCIKMNIRPLPDVDLAAIVEAVQPGCTKQEPANRHDALPWSYRRYGSEPDKGYTIIAKAHGATHGTPIAYLADGEVAGQAAQDICNAHNAAITAEAAQPQNAAADDNERVAELREALNIANYLWRAFYAEEAPHWQPFDNVRGLLTQIDNMVTGIPKPAAVEVVQPTAPTEVANDISQVEGALELCEPEDQAAFARLKPLLKSSQPASAQPQGETVVLEWRDGEPPFPWREEWFIAETIYGARVVLRSLPEEYSYDYKTADDTYMKARNIARWMQFPDSEFKAPPAPARSVPDVDAVMAKAQEFASAWALVGGRFDDGNGLEGAEQLKRELRALLAAAPAQGRPNSPTRVFVLPMNVAELIDNVFLPSNPNKLRVACQDVKDAVKIYKESLQAAQSRIASAPKPEGV